MNLDSFFKDLLVVELSSVLAGPAVGMFFAELGARVIKVENKKTKGDVTRSWKLPVEAADQALSAYYHSINWNKETYLMDLFAEADQKQVLDWISKADIVISNFKAGSDRKVGMDYESLKAINPSLIYASISAYGEDDPRPGFDAMIQAESGWIFMNGEKEGNPVKMPVALMDILTAHQLKEGILVALLHRAKTGEGSKVHASLFDTGVASLANQASNWLNLNVLPQRKGSQHPNIAPYGDIFYTKDDRAIILGTGTQKQFEALCDTLQLSGLKQDERFLHNADRLTNRPALNEYLAKAFSEIHYEKLKQLCEKNGVTIAPVNNMEEVFNLPNAKELILEETHEDGSVSKRVRTAVFKIGND